MNLKGLILAGALALGTATFTGCTEYELSKVEEVDTSQPTDTDVNGKTITDTFEQDKYQQPTDVLWVIDNSCSMSDDQNALAYNLQQFLGWFDTSGADYRLGLVTTDMEDPTQSGRFQGNPKVITPETPDGALKFFTTVAGLGTNGASTEKGRQPIYAALTEETGYNVTEDDDFFLRDNSKLHTIIVSDEPDNSEISLGDFIDWYENDLKADPTDAYVHVVGNFDTDYPWLANDTGGKMYNIEQWDWVLDLVNDLDNMLLGLEDTFYLSHNPVLGTIDVYVDSYPEFYTWDYEEGPNAVIFEQDHVPDYGSIIEVQYERSD
ncbi:MAG: hypothetical protein ABIF40_03200 [archaeon]